MNMDEFNFMKFRVFLKLHRNSIKFATIFPRSSGVVGYKLVTVYGSFFGEGPASDFDQLNEVNDKVIDESENFLDFLKLYLKLYLDSTALVVIFLTPSGEWDFEIFSFSISDSEEKKKKTKKESD